MKSKITSAQRLILDNVIDLASEKAKGGAATAAFSSAIELALSEMVRECMRQIVQSRLPTTSASILERALEDSFAKVEGELRSHGIRLGLASYKDQIRKSLKPVAAEMEKLGERLGETRRAGRLLDEEIVSTPASAQYEVREIGLRGLTEGLFARPTGDCFEVDLSQLPDGCVVSGDWYPFEIRFNDFLFVLDDDGSIYVSVENLPGRIVEDVRGLLHGLAGRIYG